MTRNSAGPLARSSLSPSCCCTAVKIDDAPESVGAPVRPSSIANSKWKSNLPASPVLFMTGRSNLKPNPDAASTTPENSSSVNPCPSTTIKFDPREESKVLQAGGRPSLDGASEDSEGLQLPSRNSFILGPPF